MKEFSTTAIAVEIYWSNINDELVRGILDDKLKEWEETKIKFRIEDGPVQVHPTPLFRLTDQAQPVGLGDVKEVWKGICRTMELDKLAFDLWMIEDEFKNLRFRLYVEHDIN